MTRQSQLQVVSNFNTISITKVGQITWEKLYNRIKNLERNATLSTGLLKELSG